MIGRDLRRSEFLLALTLYLRLVWFVRVRRTLRTIDSPKASPMTVAHNLKGLHQRLNRMLLLIDPLSALEHIPRDSHVLVIGPRNEWDLLLLRRAGFDMQKITGLDLISYSPRILIGDMHAIPFPDGQFDVVLCGWTLSYSGDPATACGEMARVCRSGGVIGVAVEYFDGDDATEREVTGGYLLKDERVQKRLNSVGQLLDLFPSRGQVFFSHDAPLRRSAQRDQLRSNAAVLFERG